MSLISKTLGHYQITSQLGKGGMGEVYRARDTKLGREVAIKVLPEDFARDAARMARFGREAKLLAALNHTNIASIYGLEDSSNTHGLVMELAQGSTLEERIKQGPIPVEEAIPIARQMADALEYAHERGIIHRDLKPANVKVAAEDTVKILDFGLAKAMETEQSGEVSTNSPTVSHLATQAGVLLGTAAYMSPEQAKAKPVDRRADIWAFGCVLYEMLTGKMAFHGDTVTETLAAVIKNEPDWTLLPAKTPMRVRVLLQRCLQKDPKQRLRDMGDARISLDEVLSGAPEGAPLPVAALPFWRRSMPWAWVAAVLGVILAGLAGWSLKPSEPRPVIRFDYELPKDQQFSDLTYAALAVSPNGKQFVYSTTRGLYLRAVDELTAKLIPGTEDNPQQPVFSPDGKWVGYWSAADKQLKKISVNGGAPVVLCDATQALNANWGADDRIVYADLGKGIMRISGNGGTPELLVKQSGLYLVNPQILPDGKTALFGIVRDPNSMPIAVQSLKSGEPKVLIEGGNGRYLPTGHLAYEVRNSLFAVPFNLGKLEIAGGPVPLIEAVFRLGGIYTPQYAVSDSGTLVYIQGTGGAVASAPRTLAWVDRKGKEAPIAAAPNNYDSPRISPDGTKVALTVSSNIKSDIWILDLVRETMTRLTFNEASAYPLWTLDGKRIAFSSGGIGKSVLYWKAADGTGEDARLSSEQPFQIPWSWSRDGKTILLIEYNIASRGTKPSIEALSMEGDHSHRPLLQEKDSEGEPKISPDGQWMAYSSDESGKNEVYVRPFPDVNKGKWQVSTSGGGDPLWSQDGRELFYRNGDTVMSVAVQSETTFKLGKTEALFQGKYAPSWDISHDGKRFLMIKPPASTGTEPTAAGSRKIVIVVNWFEELKQRVPAK